MAIRCPDEHGESTETSALTDPERASLRAEAETTLENRP